MVLLCGLNNANIYPGLLGAPQLCYKCFLCRSHVPLSFKAIGVHVTFPSQHRFPQAGLGWGVPWLGAVLCPASLKPGLGVQ